MKWVDLEFLNTYVYFDKGKEPVVFSDIPQAMSDYRYPRETQWRLITSLDCVMSHIESGVDVNQGSYVQGFVDSCEETLQSAQSITKHQAILAMSNDHLEKVSPLKAADLKERWVKGAIEKLAQRHKRSGLDLNHRYQVGSYNAYQRLKKTIDQHIEHNASQSQGKGSKLDVEF